MNNMSAPTALRPSLLRRCLWSVFCAAGLALGIVAPAATYYVDVPGGGDGTVASPYSLAQVNANAGNFAGGDRILFKRGVTFPSTGLVIPSSGAPGNPIVYGSYSGAGDYPGTGALPILPGAAGVDSIKITNRNNITIENLQVGSGAKGVSGNTVHNIVLQGLKVLNCSSSGIVFQVGGNITVDACELNGFGNGGIFFVGSPIAPDGTQVEPLHDVTISNCIVHDAHPTSKSDGIVVHVENTGTLINGVMQYGDVGANFSIHDNLVYNCKEEGFDITSGTNITLERNRTYHNHAGSVVVGHTARNVKIRYHRAENEPYWDTGGTLRIQVPNVLVEYSTFIGTGGDLGDYDGNPGTPDTNANNPIVQINPGLIKGGGALEQQPEDVVLRNNVFVWNSPATGNAFLLNSNSGFAPTIQRLTLKNNIWASRSPVAPTLTFPADRAPDYAGFVIRNNLYDDAPAIAWNVGGAGYAGFAAYQAAFDPSGAWNEKTGDPLFVAPGAQGAAAGDFHLQPGSPARDAGTSMTGADPDLNLLAWDFSSPAVAVPQNGVRDIGAFEFGVAIAAPTNLTATAIGPQEVQLAWADNSDNETAFRLQRKTGAGGAYADTTPATVAANTVTFSDTNGVAGNTTYTYQVRAENADGTSAWSNEASAATPEADTTAPEITGLTATPDHLWPANHKMVAVTLAATATDNKDPSPVTKILSVTSSEAANGQGDGNTATDWAITGDLTLNLRAERAGNGPGRLYTVTVQSTDASGNSSTAVVLIPVGHNNDTQAPTVALTAPANGALLGGSVALAATASDNDSVVGVQFQLDGANLGVEDSSEPYGLVWNTTAASNSNHTLTAIARDENGNMATSAAVTVFVDNAPPSVAVTAPAANSLLTGGGLTLTATATDNVAVVGVQFQLDGAPLGAELTAAPYELTWDSSAVADGSHTITAVARDTIGNTATSAAVAITTDNLAPSVVLTAPAANAVVGGAAVALAATASDLVGVAGVQFLVDGNPVGPEDTTAPYSIAWDSTAVSNGSHALTAVARDLVGHSAESAAVTVTVDNTPPTVALTAPTDGATVSGSSVAVTATAADDTGVLGVQFKLDGVNLGAEDTTAPYGVVWNTTTATPGVHTLTATARDTVGNTTTSALVTVTVEAVSTPFQMSGNQVVMEAEHATTRTAGNGATVYNWVDVTEAGASGAATNNAVQSLPNAVDAAVATPGPVACRADYQITVPVGSAAAFFVHVRARGANGNDDSINVSIDGVTAPVQQLNLPRSATLGAWVRSNGTLAIPAGTHTVTLWMRENGAVVDKLVLKDNTTLPTGTGPAESPR
jgi:hypothetical protein